MTDLDQGDLNFWGDQIFLGGPKTPLHTMMVKKKKKLQSRYFSEQAILDFLFTIFSPHSTTKYVVL